MPSRYKAFDSFKLWEKPHLPVEYLEGKLTAILVAREMVRRPSIAFSLASLNDRFREYATPHDSLIITGSNGFGKTALAATVINLHIAQGIGARLVTPRGLWFRIKATFNNTGEREADIIQELIDVPLLAIDEFNAPPTDSGYFSNVIEHIVRSRYNSETPKPLIVTTNSEPEDLKAWGRQTLACLYEMSHRVRMGGLPLRDEGVQPAKESF
jgi:DNA replication protein DnaC